MSHEPNALPYLFAVHTMQAARMIGDSGEGWEDDVVPSMRAGMSQFMADATETAGGASLQDSIIVASINGIQVPYLYSLHLLLRNTNLTARLPSFLLFQGKDAPNIKALLLGSAVYKEDQRIPTALFWVLHLAIIQVGMGGSNDDAKASRVKVKRWVSVLIKRSLFIQTSRCALSTFWFCRAIAPLTEVLFGFCPQGIGAVARHR